MSIVLRNQIRVAGKLTGSINERVFGQLEPKETSKGIEVSSKAGERFLVPWGNIDVVQYQSDGEPQK